MTQSRYCNLVKMLILSEYLLYTLNERSSNYARRHNNTYKLRFVYYLYNVHFYKYPDIIYNKWPTCRFERVHEYGYYITVSKEYFFFFCLPNREEKASFFGLYKSLIRFDCFSLPKAIFTNDPLRWKRNATA